MASSSVCFMHFRYMFHLDVACVSSRCCICCIDYICMLQCMFQIFHLFQTYVASVLSVCFICCNGYIRMLKVYVSNVSSISDVCCKCFFSRCVAVTMHISCKCMFQCFTCFTRMLQHVLHVVSVFISGRNMFYAFQMYVSSECCMFFIWMLHKSRSGVANVDLVLTYMHVHGRVAQKRSEGRNSMRGHGCGAQHVMKQNTQQQAREHHVGAGGQAHSCNRMREAMQTAAGATCGWTHQARGMGATGGVGAGIRTGARVRTSWR
jgi:hypothetical protein